MAMMMQTNYFSDLNDIVGDNIVGQYCGNIVRVNLPDRHHAKGDILAARVICAPDLSR